MKIFDQCKISELSTAERILLAEELWNSILPEQHKFEITDDQKKELELRLADYDENPEAGTLWNQFKTKIKNRK